MIKVIKHEYHKGLFGVDEVSEVALNNALLANILKVLPSTNVDNSNSNGANNSNLVAITNPNNVYSLKYTTRVDCGLFSGILKGKLVPTISYATTHLEYSDSLKKMLNKFFDNRPPLSIINIIYLNKYGRYFIASPSFNYEEAVSGVKVVWNGLNLNIKYNPEFNIFENQLIVPNLQLSAPTKVDITMTNLIYTSHTKYSVNNIKVGQSNLSVDTLKINVKDKVALGFRFGDILSSLTGINGVEFLNGIDAVNPTNFALNKLSYVSSSQDENDYFGAKATAKFATLVTNSKTYGPMELDLSVNHILAAPFSKMVDKVAIISASVPVASGSTNTSKVQDSLISAIKEYAGPILVNKPEINLNKFMLNGPNGVIYVAGHATTNNFVLKDMNSQADFMQKMLLDVQFSIPKHVLSYMFMLQMKYLLSAGNAEMDQQSSEAFGSVVNILLDNQINTWSKKGYIKNNKGILESHLSYREGKLFLNGVPSK
jgi:uncharacterized protein YdgA (DUF945 family)